MELDISMVERSKNDLKKGLKLPNKLTYELAEDIGIMVGDGHIRLYVRYKRAADYAIACYGNAITDKVYFMHYVQALKKHLFNLNFRFSKRQKNTCELLAYSKGLFQFYTKVIGLPDGNKRDVKVPDIILNSNGKVKCAFLRGLADTDFSLVFKRRDKDALYYPTIKIPTCSKPLIHDLAYLLRNLGFKFSVSYDLSVVHSKTGNTFVSQQLHLYGKKALKRWMEVIGFNNPKNVLKYALWKKNGFCPPNVEIEKMVGPVGFEPTT